MTLCQRWRDQRGSYRVPDETIRTQDYGVAPVTMTEAKAFVIQHHYSRSYPACRYRFGLFTRGELVGVAVFSMPMTARVLTNVFPGNVMDSVELGRFVLLDSVPGNGETWFLARCREHLRREGLRGIVAFSDDTPRVTGDGQTVFAGHLGTIYQASNAVFLGRGTARTLRVLPDGTVLSERAISKIRRQERGWRYAAEILVRYGAQPYQLKAINHGLSTWLDTWLPRLTTRLKHPGNLRYAWRLTRSVTLPCSLPYPKRAE